MGEYGAIQNDSTKNLPIDGCILIAPIGILKKEIFLKV